MYKSCIINLILIALLCGCATRSIKKVAISKDICKSDEIKFHFEPVIDQSSSLRNQQLASLYVYQLLQRMKSSEICYQEIIKELNK